MVIMRIEINLNEETAKAIQEKADAVNQSRKGYIELLCIQDVKPLMVLKKPKSAVAKKKK